MVAATMKPKVSTKLEEQAAARGSSLFKMNLLHWAETLYQKLEKACTESEVVQILVPLANGSEEMEAVMIIDILRRAKTNVTVTSVEEKPEIVASRKVKLIADVLLDDVLELQYKLFVLPGGISGSEEFSRSSVGLLKKQVESYKLYGAMCASPAIVLEPHG